MADVLEPIVTLMMTYIKSTEGIKVWSHSVFSLLFISISVYDSALSYFPTADQVNSIKPDQANRNWCGSLGISGRSGRHRSCFLYANFWLSKKSSRRSQALEKRSGSNWVLV